MRYRKRMTRKVITAHENNQPMPMIKLWESISEIFMQACKYDVIDRTIHNNFDKAGFFVRNENFASTKD